MAKAWDETTGPPKGEKRDVERVKIDTGGQKTIRLVGDVLPRYVYWITTNEGKKFPVECLQFDRETEKFDPTAPDPINEIPDSIFKDNAQFAYVCNVIDRDDGKIKLFDLKRTIYNQIIEFAQNPEYLSPSDPKTGYDLTVKKEKTGPLSISGI